MCAGVTMFDPMRRQGAKKGTRVGIVGPSDYELSHLRPLITCKIPCTFENVHEQKYILHQNFIKIIVGGATIYGRTGRAWRPRGDGSQDRLRVGLRGHCDFSQRQEGGACTPSADSSQPHNARHWPIRRLLWQHDADYPTTSNTRRASTRQCQLPNSHWGLDVLIPASSSPLVAHLDEGLNVLIHASSSP